MNLSPYISTFIFLAEACIVRTAWEQILIMLMAVRLWFPCKSCGAVPCFQCHMFSWSQWFALVCFHLPPKNMDVRGNGRCCICFCFVYCSAYDSNPRIYTQMRNITKVLIMLTIYHSLKKDKIYFYYYYFKS